MKTKQGISSVNSTQRQTHRDWRNARCKEIEPQRIGMGQSWHPPVAMLCATPWLHIFWQIRNGGWLIACHYMLHDRIF